MTNEEFEKLCKFEKELSAELDALHEEMKHVPHDSWDEVFPRESALFKDAVFLHIAVMNMMDSATNPMVL